jgi:putative phosphoesterase
VGVVADSHVGEYRDALPGGVAAALEGCDVIVHAGDVSVAAALDPLREIAPVVAVAGDHDRGDAARLPRMARLDVAGCRIGVMHGSVGRPLDTAITVAQCLAPVALPWRRVVHRGLRRRMPSVDVIVYGHWHAVTSTREDGVLMVSPGALCPLGSLEGDGRVRRSPAGLADLAVRRFRHVNGIRRGRGHVAILDVTPDGPRVSHVAVPVTP